MGKPLNLMADVQDLSRNTVMTYTPKISKPFFERTPGEGGGGAGGVLCQLFHFLEDLLEGIMMPGAAVVVVNVW